MLETAKSLYPPVARLTDQKAKEDIFLKEKTLKVDGKSPQRLYNNGSPVVD